MEKTVETFGERISRLREAKGWTQEQLSVKSTVARRTIQNIEGMKNSPSLDAVIEIARALGVSNGYLIEGSESEQSPQARKALIIIDIQSILFELSEDDLETVKVMAEGRRTLSQSEKKAKNIK